MKDFITKAERRKAIAEWNRRADAYRKNPDGVFLFEAAGVFGSDDPAIRAHADDMKKQLARLAPEVIVLNHRPAPTDTPARQARAIANALDACEKIAPNAKVYLVSNVDPGEFAAAYRAALEYRRARDRRLA